MDDLYLIPSSFPCEFCNSKIKVEIPSGTNKFKSFICLECDQEQRMTYFGKYFGIIKNVK